MATPNKKQLDPEAARAYWGANLRLMITLLIVWFSVSFGCGILFRDALDA
ncbi:MAG: sodium/substrate symporter small subunit, partial [Pseudomonadota bacterium]